MQTTKALNDHAELDGYDAGDPCPAHGTKYRKVYTYGSTMTGEAEVTAFHGCGCATCVRHDPVGTLPSVARYYRTFGAAAGAARLHAEVCGAKYR